MRFLAPASARDATVRNQTPPAHGGVQKGASAHGAPRSGGKYRDGYHGPTVITRRNPGPQGGGNDIEAPTRTQAREWIIRRCTQQWIGADLQYEDWPVRDALNRWFARPCTAVELMSREEMLAVLELCERQWPGNEFSGHNVANCHCPGHASLKSFLSKESR